MILGSCSYKIWHLNICQHGQWEIVATILTFWIVNWFIENSDGVVLGGDDNDDVDGCDNVDFVVYDGNYRLCFYGCWIVGLFTYPHCV